MPTSPGAISPVPCPNTCAIHCLISLSDVFDIFIWFIFIFIWYLVTILVTMMKVTATTHGSLRVIQIFTRSPNSSKQTLGRFIFSFSQWVISNPGYFVECGKTWHTLQTNQQRRSSASPLGLATPGFVTIYQLQIPPKISVWGNKSMFGIHLTCLEICSEHGHKIFTWGRSQW